MKKFLIFLILFTSIFIIGNAKAITVDYTSSSEYEEQLEFFYNGNPISSYGDSNRDYILNTLIGGEKYKDYGQYYFCHVHNGGRGGGCYITDYPENIYFKSNREFVVKYVSDKPVYHYYLYNGSIYNSGYITSDAVGTRDSNSNGANKYNYERTNISEIKYISDDGTDLIFNDGYVVKNNTIFNHYDISKNRLSLYSSKPTITFSKTENTENVNDNELVTSVDLNVKFSSIDNEKYIYRYRVLPSEEWTTMTLTSNDNFDINLTSNTSVVVEILDLETKESVTSSTYTIDSISDIDVSIAITKNEDLNCIANYNNTQVETCANLDIYFSYINFDKYYYQYSIDNGNNYINIKSDDIKNNIFNYILNNEYLIVRVIDKTTKVEKAINTYTFSKFQELPKDPYINFEIYYTFDMCTEDEIGTTICVNYEMVKSDKFNEIDKNKVEIRNMSATLFVKIYNYNENYNYYYYDDTGGCIKITKSLLKNDGYSYYYTSIDLYSNVEITVDIHDENDNYLKSYTYKVIGFENVKKDVTFESMLEQIKLIFKNDNNIFDYFNSIYTKLRNSKIGSFIYFIILSSILLLIINALQR